MIIFGSRTKNALVAALVFACSLCHATAAQRLIRSRTWFTLFFLPVFPFGHGRYLLQCSYCGQSQTLDRSTADRFVADADAARERLRAHGTLPGAPLAPVAPGLPAPGAPGAPGASTTPPPPYPPTQPA